MKNKGITLLALIVTVIIMVILATVTINLVNNGGTIDKTKEAVNQYKYQADKEQFELAKVGATNYLTGEVKEEELESALEGWLHEGKTWTSPNGNEFSLLINGEPDEERRYILKDEDEIKNQISERGYIGYYADIDGDEEVDGIIYADLAISVTGQWVDSSGNYSYIATNVNDLKDYYISNPSYTGTFGTAPVLRATESGNDRFYVMDLEDIEAETGYYWYFAAYGNIYDYSDVTSWDFGTGKVNTNNMVAKWNSEEYGNQNQGEDFDDMWGVIQTKVNKGWFVPAKEEWSAFAENLGITNENRVSKNLSKWYWTSSLDDEEVTYFIDLIDGNIGDANINIAENVRLSSTF